MLQLLRSKNSKIRCISSELKHKYWYGLYHPPVFSHCCQYSGVCISDKRETVRSKANNSSSPVKIFAANPAESLPSAKSSISIRVSSDSSRLPCFSFENSCLNDTSQDMTTRIRLSYSVSIRVINRRAWDLTFRFSCGTSRMMIVWKNCEIWR